MRGKVLVSIICFNYVTVGSKGNTKPKWVQFAKVSIVFLLLIIHHFFAKLFKIEGMTAAWSLREDTKKPA